MGLLHKTLTHYIIGTQCFYVFCYIHYSGYVAVHYSGINQCLWNGRGSNKFAILLVTLIIVWNFWFDCNVETQKVINLKMYVIITFISHAGFDRKSRESEKKIEEKTVILFSSAQFL